MRRDYVYGYPTKDENSVRCFVAASCGSGYDHPHPKVTFHSDLMYCMDCHRFWFAETPSFRAGRKQTFLLSQIIML